MLFKTFYILLLNIVIYTASTANTAKIDSLNEIVSIEKNDTSKIKVYFKNAWNNWYSDIEFSKQCTDSAFQIAKEMEYSSAVAKSYHYYGLYNRLKGNATEAIAYFEKALEEYGPEADSLKISGTIYNLGVMHFNDGDYDKALEYHIVELKINQKYKNEKGICNSLNSIGLVFKRFMQFEKAIDYLEKAYDCSLDVKDKQTQSIVLENLSSIYNQQKNPEKGMFYARKALRVESELGNVLGIGMGNYHVAVSHFENKLLDSAHIYINNSINYLEKIDFGLHLSDAYMLKGQILISKNEYLEAIKYFNQSLTFSQKAKHNKRRSEIYFVLSESHEALGNYKTALEFYKNFEHLDDSLLNISKIQIVNDLEIKYDSEKKETEIEKQNITIKNQIIQRNAISGGSILFISLLTAIFWSITQRNKQKQLILEHASEINEQQIMQLEKENKILSMSSMIEGQESERKRIAQDLHDGLGGLLATIKVKFGIIQKEIAALESMNVYQQTSTMIDDACTEVRKIAHNMMPDSLSKLGLIEAVRDIAEYTPDIKIEVVDLGTHQFTETQQIMLYRVIQEFLNNTRKHANASQVIVQFSKNDRQSIVYLEDDGQGFDVHNKTDQKGIGLKSMESRINFINGEYKLSSILGVGTILEICIIK